MPLYSYACPACNTQFDRISTIAARNEQDCDTCKARLERVYTAETGAVIGDDIPGGYVVRHGLVNADGSPRTFYSKSEMAKEAKRRGLINYVVHTPIPKSGSDKSVHTVKWF